MITIVVTIAITIMTTPMTITITMTTTQIFFLNAHPTGTHRSVQK